MRDQRSITDRMIITARCLHSMQVTMPIRCFLLSIPSKHLTTNVSYLPNWCASLFVRRFLLLYPPLQRPLLLQTKLTSTMLRIGLTVSLCQCVTLTWPSNSKHSLMKLNGTTRSCAKGTLFTNTGAAWKTTPSVANWCVIISWWQTFNYYSKATLESTSKFLGIRRANVFFLNSAT